MTEKEIWKPVKDFEDKYEISNMGRLRNKINGQLLKPQIRGNYLKATLFDSGKRFQISIHKLMALTFLNKNDFKSMPDEDRKNYDLDKLQINHKNENKLDNQLNNLEWCTAKYNTYYSNGVERCAKAKEKPIDQYDLDGNFIATWESIKKASETLNINKSSISQCVRERRKTHGYIFRYRGEVVQNK